MQALVEMQREAAEQKQAEAHVAQGDFAKKKALATVRARQMEEGDEERARQKASGEHDWTGVYDKWDKYDDPEELLEADGDLIILAVACTGAVDEGRSGTGRDLEIL